MLVYTVSTPLSQNRGAVLEAAQRLIEAEGWSSLTASRVADESGFSRQWLHSLFGGHQRLVDGLAASLFGPWQASQLELVAARLPLEPTVERSFTLLVDSPGALAISLRQLMTESGSTQEKVWQKLERTWAPVWRAERELSKNEVSASTAVFFWSSLGLELHVRRGDMSTALAKRTLISVVQGALRPT